MSREVIDTSGESEAAIEFLLAQQAARAKFQEALIRQAAVPNTELYLTSSEDEETGDDVAWFHIVENYEALLAGGANTESLRVGLPIYRDEDWARRPEQVALRGFFDEAYLLVQTNTDAFASVHRLKGDARVPIARGLALKIKEYQLVPGRFTDSIIKIAV